MPCLTSIKKRGQMLRRVFARKGWTIRLESNRIKKTSRVHLIECDKSDPDFTEIIRKLAELYPGQPIIDHTTPGEPNLLESLPELTNTAPQAQEQAPGTNQEQSYVEQEEEHPTWQW